jgi:putative ATP-binding cassette transporter
MRLISLFLRYPRRALIIAALAGLLSGTCNTALIAFINSSFKHGVSDFHLCQDFPGPETGALETVIEGHLRRLHLSDKVRVKDGKLTPLRLSQGKRKRLALPACHPEDRPAYFFDEWAADQAPYFREAFYQPLLPGLVSRGKTLPVITYDDRYVHLADRIVKPVYGRVVSQGAPSEEAREPATQGD